MTDRLVLGSDSLVTLVAESLQDRHGGVQVGTADESRASTLREQGIDVEDLDPTDETALATLDADIVAVFEESYARNLAVARAARRAFPDAYLLAYAGRSRDADVTADQVETTSAAETQTVSQDGPLLASIADEMFDPSRAVASHLQSYLGTSGRRVRQLREVLQDIERLGVIAHDNPDPDAIASGTALVRLAESVGCSAELCYFGDITHQENRAFVNLLDLDLRNLDPTDDISEFDGLALVDHSRPGVNDQLPEDSTVDVVIDHHPPRAPVNARFVDLRSDVGATSTLLVTYLEQFGVGLDEAVATALLFGIHIDTNGFSREVSQEDFEAAATLVPPADLAILERIESPSISGTTMETIARAIQNRRIEGEVLLSCVGELPERDALAQAADRLLGLEGVSTTMVYGVMDGTIFASARSRTREVDIGETLRDAFDKVGSAGGHVDMAGAQITLGMLDAVEDREQSLHDIVETVIADRFLDAIEANTARTVTGFYTDTFDDEGYFVTEEFELGDIDSEDT